MADKDPPIELSPVSVAEPWRPQVNPWLIAVVVAMAAFMEVLDTSIANVALPYMAGSQGASNDESTWVLTSYLVSNAVVLPICGWFASALGRKQFFMICLTIFTLSSLLCGIAPSLGTIILFRVMQGAGGAACSLWHRRSWPTRSLLKSAAWPSRSTASQWSSHLLSDRPSAVGSLTTILGAGFSSSICRSAFWHCSWFSV